MSENHCANTSRYTDPQTDIAFFLPLLPWLGWGFILSTAYWKCHRAFPSYIRWKCVRTQLYKCASALDERMQRRKKSIFPNVKMIFSKRSVGSPHQLVNCWTQNCQGGLQHSAFISTHTRTCRRKKKKKTRFRIVMLWDITPLHFSFCLLLHISSVLNSFQYQRL